MRSTVTTSKRIDLGQLDSEMGGAGLRATTLDSGTTIESDVAQATLEAAVSAHVAIDKAGNETTLRSRAVDALATNRTFLARISLTNTQVSDQVKALTRQNNGLIRILLQQFDGTD